MNILQKETLRKVKFGHGNTLGGKRSARKVHPLTKIEIVKYVEGEGISRNGGVRLLRMVKNITRRDKHEIPVGSDYRFLKESTLAPFESRLNNAVLYVQKRYYLNTKTLDLYEKKQ
jgi:hypothetical protein